MVLRKFSNYYPIQCIYLLYFKFIYMFQSHVLTIVFLKLKALISDNLKASIAFQLFVGSIGVFMLVFRLVKKSKHDNFSVFSVCSIQVLASHMLYTIIYLITVVLSPVLNVDESGIVDASNSPCTVLGIVFHFVIVLQFSSMFMNALLLYLILIKGYFVIDPSQKKKSNFLFWPVQTFFIKSFFFPKIINT